MTVLPVLPASLLPAPAAPALLPLPRALCCLPLQLPLPLPLLPCCCHPVTMPPLCAHAEDPCHLALLTLQICNLGSRGR